MVRQVFFIVFLAFWGLFANGNPNAAGQSNSAPVDDRVGTYSSIAPPYAAPGKDLFVTREGDPFVVTVTATCLLEDDSETQFELLPSAPGFIHVSDTYRKENRAFGYTEGLGVVYITPQVGDAGKYSVILNVKACSGKVERLITFKIHIKPARQD